MMRKTTWRALIVVVAAGAITSAALALYEPGQSTARDAEDIAPRTNDISNVPAITRELANFDANEFETESSTANKDDSPDDARKLPSQPTAAVDSPDETDAFSESLDPAVSADEEIELIEPTTGKSIALDDFLKRAERICVVFSDRKVRFPIDRKVPTVRLAAAIRSLAREKKSRARLTAIDKELVMKVDRDKAVHAVHTLTHLLFEEYDVLLPTMRNDQKIVIRLPDRKRSTIAGHAIEPEEVRTVVARVSRISLNLGRYNIIIETPDRIHWRRLANRLVSLKEFDPKIRFIDGRDHLLVWLSSPVTDVVQITEAITRELSYFDSDEYDRDVAAGGRLRPFSDPDEELSGIESTTSQSGDGDPAREPAMRLPMADTSVRLQEQYLAQEKEAAEIGRMIMNATAPADKETLRRKLRQAVAKSFALRQQLHHSELAAFQARMARTQRLIEAREQIKDQIIDRRVEDLVNPRLKWEPSPTDSRPAQTKPQPAAPFESQAGANRSEPTSSSYTPREEAREILQQVLWQGTQPMKSSWFDDDYPYSEILAEQTRKENARFLPDYVALLNEYLENHQADYGTRPYLSAVQSLEYVLRSWFAGDPWPLQKTEDLLAAALAEDESSFPPDLDDPLAVETRAVVLRQLARLTMQIPEGVARSIPRSQKTRDKLALLNDLLSHRANARWVSQEQIRLAGLLNEAPFHAVRAIMQAESRKDSASIEHWLYAVSSPAAYDAYQSSPPQHVRPPLDPLLMLAILRKLTGNSEHTDARIAGVFANPHPSLLFPRHIDDVLSGRWAFREMAHDALLEMATKTNFVELRTLIEKLDPRVAAARQSTGGQ
jgi:hypothetical protein